MNGLLKQFVHAIKQLIGTVNKRANDRRFQDPVLEFILIAINELTLVYIPVCYPFNSLFPGLIV